LAKIVRIPFVRQLMVWGIMTVVARHRVGIGVVLFNQHRQVLLLRHVFHPEIPWGIPGGWLNRDEDPAEGALRELREETGLTAVLGPILLMKREKYPSHLGMAYLAYQAEGSLQLSGEIIEAKWTDLDDLPTLLSFNKNAIEEAAVLYDNLVM
jgi:8-oxo-dGTP diphosphatase